MSTPAHDWWSDLRHGGMLIAPALLDEFYPALPDLDRRSYDRLRSAWLAAEGGRETSAAELRRAFVSTLLEDSLNLRGWQKAAAVDDAFKAVSISGEPLRPSWALPAADGGASLVVRFDDAERVGVGRGRRAHARLVELMRKTGVPLGLLTNGRQLRLVHAGPDYDAWAEWDATSWFDEGEGRESLCGLHAVLGSLDGDTGRVTSQLASAIRASRDRQGDLAQVLGEQVRRAVELLVAEVDEELDRNSELRSALWHHPENGELLGDDETHAALFQAATRIVMRLVLILYAESRDLLPASLETYHDSYGVEGLYRLLSDAHRDGTEGSPGPAWLRLTGLFRLIHAGSPHPDLPVRAYGGELFRPGDPTSPDPVLRALAAFEVTRPSDGTIYRLLRLLKIGRIKVRAGKSSRWVAGPVDFSDLRTEYIGIVYEGLLDYELRRAPEDDPIVFLNVGRQPALPLSRLEALSAADRKKLLETFKKDVGPASGDGDVEEPEESEESVGESEAEEPDEDLAAAEDVAESAEETIVSTDDGIVVVRRWAKEAVVDAGRVRRPRGRSTDPAEFEKRVGEAATKLIADVVPPGRLYLVASGGLRKGSGSFYTRPALAVPLVQRTLEPLCYKQQDGVVVPRTSEEILALKIGEPAMGSGSFLVGSLRYLVDALVASLEHHGHIQPRGDRETIVTLPFGVGATGEENEEVFDLPPEDDRFLAKLRPRLARHVVERCLYGVDINPMAVELARLALWVETLDRELPFEYLDHKLKCGNSLVGCWLHLVDDYPLRALDREGGDGHKGERTKWLKAKFAQAKQEMPDVIRAMGGALTLFDGLTLPAEDVVARVRKRFEKLHDLPQELRENAYRELLESQEYRTLKLRMDLWCALWFWPPGDDSLPLPRTWSELDATALLMLDRVVGERRFFHWEIEFPDVFGPERSGFDAVLGNPPWETVQMEPVEFFSGVDPLYRSYGKAEASVIQHQLFDAVNGLEDRWKDYDAGFKSLLNWIKGVATAFDIPLGRSRSALELAEAWSRRRLSVTSLARRDVPFVHQGTGKVFTYKAFVEVALHLVDLRGRIGLVVPAGLYTDRGSTAIRKTLLSECAWEWAYFFENRQRIFPIHSSYKYGLIVLQHGSTTEVINGAFMRRDVVEWERPWGHATRLFVKDIQRFAPTTWSFMELRGDRDLEVVRRIYAEHELLGDFIDRNAGRFQLEFMMNTHDRIFRRRSWLERNGLLAEQDDMRHPCVRARLRIAGYVPLYEGKSFWLHDPYFAGVKSRDSVSKFVALEDIERELTGDSWQDARLVYRALASSTNQRTLVAALMPPAVHGNASPSLEGAFEKEALLAILNSLALDFIIRMKVSVNVNWHYVETLPIARWESKPDSLDIAKRLARRLNAIGEEFDPPVLEPIFTPKDRLAARLLLDSLVADLYGLHIDDVEHIAAHFPIYDKNAPAELGYQRLAVEVYRTMCADGPDAAEQFATALVEVRREAGCGFGLDQLWQPAEGWEQANREAREILKEAGLR